MDQLAIPANKAKSDVAQPSYASTAISDPKPTAATQTSTDSSVLSKPHVKHPSTTNNDRKFNSIIYGIKECGSGVFRHQRLKQALDAASAIINKIDSEISSLSIRDSMRLGKYVKQRDRPLLVQLTRSADVATVLSKRSRSADTPNISIKPDLNKQERPRPFWKGGRQFRVGCPGRQ